MEKIISLAKRRGFIYPGSEIYGGLGGTWDYGPAGVELKNNIKREWWRTFVQLRDDVVGIDAAILMNPKVWEASGHLESFTDPLVECKVCHERLRADHEDEIKEHEKRHQPRIDRIETGPKEKDFWTEPQKFNLMVEASLGVIEGKKQTVYLRGEITQGVHVNFKNVLDSTRIKIPFGIAQVGKAFRNEITPGNFTFRSREFEQFEIQYYIKPDEKEGKKWFEYWKNEVINWYLSLGIKKENLRFRDHTPDERAHYAKDACDLEYNSPFGGWKEFQGIHHRADWDLSRHSKFSSEKLTYTDPETKKEFTPWDIESSGGVDRATLFFLIDAYEEEKLEKDETRVVLRLHPKLAPYKVAVFPLLANKQELINAAKKIYDDLKIEFMTAWDDRGNIGKRYRAQDEVGTPYCVTIDFESLEDNAVTVRDRDSMKQERIAISELKNYLKNELQKTNTR